MRYFFVVVFACNARHLLGTGGGAFVIVNRAFDFIAIDYLRVRARALFAPDFISIFFSERDEPTESPMKERRAAMKRGR